MIVRPVVSILIVILELLGWYEGAITWICSIILNISVSLAMYSLILIYHVFHNELIPRKPLAKILCIKGVVFFSFWQVNPSLSLTLLAQWFVFTLLSLKDMGHLEKQLMRFGHSLNALSMEPLLLPFIRLKIGTPPSYEWSF